MGGDDWLERWLPLVRERAGGRPVLEIGCGSGVDTETLVRAGLQVTAFDLDPAAVEQARRRVPQARVGCQNVLDPFPNEAQALGVVVASLSLHYFDWVQTQALERRIRDTLRPGGVFLCRLNSTEDRNFGARGHREIERHYYRVDGQAKRFFDRADVESLFGQGWQWRSLEHRRTQKYVMAKALWEVVAEKRPDTVASTGP